MFYLCVGKPTIQLEKHTSADIIYNWCDNPALSFLLASWPKDSVWLNSKHPGYTH